MLDDINKLLSKWMAGQRSQKLMSAVLEAMAEARQKVRASDSPFRSLARRCIDKAEDAYQDAIYQLKDGEPMLSFKSCRQGLKYISMATLHLSELNGKSDEPFVDPDSPWQASLDLASAISRFKTSVEYNNCQVTEEMRERLVEVVHMFHDSAKYLKEGEDEDAVRLARCGTLWMYFLGKELEDKLKASIVDVEALERCVGTASRRLLDLIDQLSEARKALAEASMEAHGRIRLYLDAAHNTLEQCLDCYIEGDVDEIHQLAKAGSMEVRMARRLIDYSTHPGAGPEPEDEGELDLDISGHEFRWRVARLQRLLSEHDKDSLPTVRRLQVVSAHYNRARQLLRQGNYTEAERFARSAHLDIDFARQLLMDKQARYSDLI